MTVRSRPEAVAPQSPELTWRRIMRLGVLGVVSDLRDRRRDPSLRNRPSVRALQDDADMHGTLRFGFRGGEYLAGYARVPDTGWAVIVEQPTSTALATAFLGERLAPGAVHL